MFTYDLANKVCQTNIINHKHYQFLGNQGEGHAISSAFAFENRNNNLLFKNMKDPGKLSRVHHSELRNLFYKINI